MLEYKIEYNFSNLVLMSLIYHISHQSHTDSLLLNWSATGRREGSGNVTGLKFNSLYLILYTFSDLNVPIID